MGRRNSKKNEQGTRRQQSSQSASLIRFRQSDGLVLASILQDVFKSYLTKTKCFKEHKTMSCELRTLKALNRQASQVTAKTASEILDEEFKEFCRSLLDTKPKDLSDIKDAYLIYTNAYKQVKKYVCHKFNYKELLVKELLNPLTELTDANDGWTLLELIKKKLTIQELTIDQIVKYIDGKKKKKSKSEKILHRDVECEEDQVVEHFRKRLESTEPLSDRLVPKISQIYLQHLKSRLQINK